MQLHASTQHNRSILEHGRSTGQLKQSRHPYYSVQCAALQTQSSKGSNSNVIERRAADVIIVGRSAAGLAAAYTLAKRGRKVLVLEDWGLDSAVSAATPPAPPFQPLKLTEQDALLVHLGTEASAYWRGLEVLAQRQLLHLCSSLDISCAPDGSHAGASAVAAIRDASRAAGLHVAELRHDEVAERCSRSLMLPHSALALLNTDAGVIRAVDAAAALRAMAERVGVMFKDRLRLRGWRDAGGHFSIRASTEILPDAVSLYEAEQLLLAPDAWTPTCLGLFGLAAPGIEMRQTALGRWPCGDELTKLPLLHCVDGVSTSTSGRSRGGGSGDNGSSSSSSSSSSTSGNASNVQLPAHGSSWFALPLVAGGRLRIGRLPSEGVHIDNPFSQIQGIIPNGAEIQALHKQAASVIRGLGDARDVALGRKLVAAVSDGRPVVGWHPGFEEGRCLVCCTTAGSTSHGPGFSGYQYAPIVAKLAADALLQGGAAADDKVLQLLAVTRAAVGGDAALLESLDSWDGLEKLQERPIESAEMLEEQAEIAEEQRKQALTQ